MTSSSGGEYTISSLAISVKDKSPLLPSGDESSSFSTEDNQESEVSISKFKPTYRLYSRRWFILVAYCLLTISALSQWFSFTAISNILQRYYRVNMIAINWFSMIYELLFIPFAIPFSFMLRKYGLGFTMVSAAFLNAMGAIIRYVGGIQRDGFWYVFAGHSVGGLATTAYLFLPPRIAAIWFGERERATATGIAVAVDALGISLGFFQSAAMVRNHQDLSLIAKDLKHFLISVAVPAVIIFIFICIVVRDKPLTPPSLSEASSTLQYENQAANAAAYEAVSINSGDTNEQLGLDKDDNVKGKRKTTQPSNYEYTEGCEIEFHGQNFVTWKSKMLGQEKSLTKPATNDDEKKRLLERDQESINFKAFKTDILALMRNTGFMLILHIHAIVWIQETIWQTLLNELLIPKFPGREFQIGVMGAAGQVGVMITNLAVGPILDRTQSFRTVTITVLAIALILMVAFVIVFNFTAVFYGLFCLYVIIAMFPASYFTIAFDHGAELTYPIPEGSSGVMLVVSAQAYGLIFAYITSLVLLKVGPIPVFVIMCVLYATGIILALPLKNRGHRSFLVDPKAS